MQIRKEDGHFVFYFTNRVFIHSLNQWRVNKENEALREATIEFLSVYYYRDGVMDLIEIGFIVFGFGAILKINTFD